MTTTATVDATVDAEVGGEVGARPWWRQPAVVVFAVVAAASAPILVHLGRHEWFRYDEWDFLASRDISDLGDLLEPHAVHWSTLPILAYRALWAVVGIRSYVPYQLLNIVVHISVVSLLMVAMRRSGVRPWTTTAAGLLLLFLGSGSENIIWAFQTTFNGSLMFGLVHLLLADHDGPLTRRDWLGLAAGFAGLLCSGVAVAMVAVVGVAVLVRRGIRPSLFHTVPLVAGYGLWFVLVSHDAYGQSGPTSLGDRWDMLFAIVRGVGLGLGRTPVLAWALAGLFVAGSWIAWRALPAVDVRRKAATPAGLLAGSVAFVLVTAAGRPEAADAVMVNNRYVYVTVVLLMPALAVACDALMRRWTPVTVAIVALAVVAGVGNVRDFHNDDLVAIQFARDHRASVLAMPRVPRAADIPAELHPDALAPWMSIGWLRGGVEQGRVPAPPALDPARQVAIEGRLLLRPQRHEPASCVDIPAPADLELQAGSSIELDGLVVVVYDPGDGAVARLPFSRDVMQPYVVSYVDGVTVRIESGGGPTVRVCDLDGGPFDVQTGA